ncbi:MAG: glycosyltransferase, partial [Bacteroidia bacterium]|nr:glycosyltransferase [Bacteroidia bacterium]
MHKPLVSILTPFKNSSKYLEECLNSIIDQTFEHWELILVDDHSSDNSWELADLYAQADPRIKLFKNPGEGIIEALRKAFDESSGALITRMDSDDIMVNEKLEHMVGRLIESGKGHVALGLVKYFSSEGISDGYDKYEKWLNALTLEGRNYSEIYKECVIPSPCWMVFRDDLLSSGAFVPGRYPEDYDLTFRFYENGLKCLPTDTLLHYWRDYPARTSRTHEHYDQNYFLDIKMHYFLKLDLDKSRPLTVWGAGYKGKTVAKHLIKAGQPFHWIC